MMLVIFSGRALDFVEREAELSWSSAGAGLGDHFTCVQAGKLELKKRLEGQLSKLASLLQNFPAFNR